MLKQEKEVLKKLAKYTCENCHKVFESSDLQIHRIKRGNAGGEYIPSNLKILCIKCHKLFHAGEFR